MATAFAQLVTSSSEALFLPWLLGSTHSGSAFSLSGSWHLSPLCWVLPLSPASPCGISQASVFDLLVIFIYPFSLGSLIQCHNFLCHLYDLLTWPLGCLIDLTDDMSHPIAQSPFSPNQLCLLPSPSRERAGPASQLCLWDTWSHQSLLLLSRQTSNLPGNLLGFAFRIYPEADHLSSPPLLTPWPRPPPPLPGSLQQPPTRSPGYHACLNAH